ncbi:MAG: class I SAM-dependent methyltransferase [Thermodesulfobacteriota bacterium]
MIEGSDFYASPDGEINARIAVHFNARKTDELVQKYGPYGAAVILGCGDGLLIRYFQDKFQRLIVVEGAKALLDKAERAYNGAAEIEWHHSYFETFTLPADKQADFILGNHVLEHVLDPTAVLTRSREWLKPTGFTIFTVPNARSLHRRIGLAMGLLDDLHDLNDQDRLVGHRRVYDRELLISHVDAAGYTVVETGGFNLKMVSQRQMKDWPPELLDAVYQVSLTCPADICSNLYIVGRKPS